MMNTVIVFTISLTTINTHTQSNLPFLLNIHLNRYIFQDIDTLPLNTCLYTHIVQYDISNILEGKSQANGCILHVIKKPVYPEW